MIKRVKRNNMARRRRRQVMIRMKRKMMTMIFPTTRSKTAKAMEVRCGRVVIINVSGRTPC